MTCVKNVTEFFACDSADSGTQSFLCAHVMVENSFTSTVA
eukprot:SAG31_NODE_19516_length_599_cov_1.730000_1_plen_39_part_10